MNTLEKIYNKAMKQFGILSLKETQSIVKKKFGNIANEIPDEQLYKVSTKFTWITNLSFIDNITNLIRHNIYEYVGLKYGIINKNYKLDFVDESGAYLISPEDYTKATSKTISFGGEDYTFTYCVPEGEVF